MTACGILIRIVIGDIFSVSMKSQT